jgi:hypothetical protein
MAGLCHRRVTGWTSAERRRLRAGRLAVRGTEWHVRYTEGADLAAGATCRRPRSAALSCARPTRTAPRTKNTVRQRIEDATTKAPAAPIRRRGVKVGGRAANGSALPCRRWPPCACGRGLPRGPSGTDSRRQGRDAARPAGSIVDRPRSTPNVACEGRRKVANRPCSQIGGFRQRRGDTLLYRLLLCRDIDHGSRCASSGWKWNRRG